MEFRFEKRAAYIQKNTDYYMKKFNTLEVTGGKVSWNWAAFFFSSVWMLYRKMYKPFIVVFVLELLVEMFLTSTATLLLSILVGLFGNYIYMKHIDERIDAEPAMDMIGQANYQRKYGGTSWKVVILYLVLYGVITGLLSSMYYTDTSVYNFL